ncbi:MAG: universal stress protein [Saprospiraceae bacterium]|nr:universal stress protein [Saprospiraceae bacterium]
MNILVLTDFSQPSEAGVSLAMDMMKTHGASVTIFHCLTEETFVDFQLGPKHKLKLADTSDPDAPDWLKKWNDIAKELGQNMRFLISGGSLVKSVNSYCNRQKVDLIIMGSSGKSKAKTWGSNTQDMVTHIHHPLLIVKSKPISSIFNKVIFASSFTEKDKKSFLIFKDLIPLPDDAEIHLLCIDKESFFSQPTPLIQEVMNDFAHLSRPYSTKKHFYQDYNVKSGIRNFSKELSPDMIVMSNSMKKKIKHLIFGNDAVNIAYDSEYPVLIINHP